MGKNIILGKFFESIYIRRQDLNCEKKKLKGDFLLKLKEQIFIMKEKRWREIEKQLCPKQSWIKDKLQQKCLCCGKQFGFFRRKHHCRFCGNIFCSDCSNYFFNGKYLGEKHEKQIRHCALCHSRLEKELKEEKKILPQIDELDDNKDIYEDEDDMETEDAFMTNIQEDAERSGKNSCEVYNKIQEQMKKIVHSASDELCDKLQIQKEYWKNKLCELAIRGATQTKMQALASYATENGMDIARQVKIKTIITDPEKGIQLMVRGIVIEKNLPTKSMIKKLVDPRVLVIQSALDLQALPFLKFQELVKNDRVIMRRILQKIVKLNVDIVFVSQSVSVFALEFLQQHKINVLSKMKVKELESIKEATGIRKSIKQIWKIEKYKEQNVVGACQKISFKTVKEGQVLMFLESNAGIRSILLGQSSEQSLGSIKRSVQTLLRLTRQIHLQKYLITVDHQMDSGLEGVFPLHTELSKSIYSNLESFLSHQEISFSKIDYYSVYMSQSSKIFQQYGMKIGKSIYRQICGKIDFCHLKLYSKDDITLGCFILLTVANYQRNCKVCNSYHHFSTYYIGNKILKIQIQKKQKSKSSFIEEFEQEPTIQNLKSFLNKQKQVITIETSIRCNGCKFIYGKPVKIGKLYLSNSFFYTLFNLSKDQIIQPQTKEQKALSKSKLTFSHRKGSENCQHEELARVFQYEGIYIMITVKEISIIKVDFIDLESQHLMGILKQKEGQFISNTYLASLIEKNQILESIHYQLQSLPFLNSSNSSSFTISVDSKYLTYFEQLNKLSEIIEKLRVQLKQIEVKSSKQLSKPRHDWTLLNRKLLKVQRVLEMAGYSLSEIARTIKKKKLDESIVRQASQSFSMQAEAPYNPDQEIEVPQIMSHSNSNSGQILNFRERSKTLGVKGSRKRFPMVQGNILKYFVPDILDPISLLACALNSGEFRKAIEDDENLMNHSPIHIKLNFHRRIHTDWDLYQQTVKIYNQILGEAADKTQTVEVLIHYPRQFEEFRNQENISNELYIRSLCMCKVWSSSGGKTNSLFAKAQNELLIVKVINQKEFEEFLKFVKEYLQFMRESKILKRNSLIAKIYGIYEVMARGKVSKCVVMQNIFLGMEAPMKVYDLKGSEVNRLNMPPENGGSYTGQDSNFKIDRNSTPIALQSLEYDKLMRMLEQDANFLKQHFVIDYSLLLICTKQKVRIGIIDYMRPYHLMEKIENIYKEIKSGRDPTVIPPNSYAQRFLSAMKKYFTRSE